MRCCGSPQNICRPNATKMRRCVVAKLRDIGYVHPALLYWSVLSCRTHIVHRADLKHAPFVPIVQLFQGWTECNCEHETDMGWGCIGQLWWAIFCLHWATCIVSQSIQPWGCTNRDLCLLHAWTRWSQCLLKVHWPCFAKKNTVICATIVTSTYQKPGITVIYGI